MGKTLKCDLCDKPATVHLTQIVSNKIHKVDLCESCAQEKGVTDPNGFSLADLLVKGLAGQTEEPVAPVSSGPVCPSCGFTLSKFKKHSRLGCPDCYTTFAESLHPMLANIHKGTRHAGKVPQGALERKSLLDRLATLEDSLREAVASERYEEAAGFRDQINELKAQLPAATVAP